VATGAVVAGVVAGVLALGEDGAVGSDGLADADAEVVVLGLSLGLTEGVPGAGLVGVAVALSLTGTVGAWSSESDPQPTRAAARAPVRRAGRRRGTRR